MTTVADVLTDEGKWVKGMLADGERYCLRGAVIVKHGLVEYLNKPWIAGEDFAAMVPAIRADFDRLAEAAAVLFPERLSGKRAPEVEVNNHEDTTFEDVLRVCKVAGV